jgi:RNA polymerase sigma factor (sigma-70 family)
VLQRVLARLPERKRLVVALRHYEGLSLREMALALGIEVEKVRTLLDEAIETLAKALLAADEKERRKKQRTGRRAA